MSAVPPLLGYALAEALTAREPDLKNVTPARLAEHEALVTRFMAEHESLVREAVEAAALAAVVPGLVPLELVVEKLLPHLIPLAGVMKNERTLF